MTLPSLPGPVAQRVVSVSLRDFGDVTAAFYTYVSPLTGLSYTNAPTCDISIDQPTLTLFVLDFASTLDGWYITGASLPPGDVFSSLQGPGNLSIQIFNPYLDSSSRSNFTINYVNERKDRKVPIDPQEGNIPRVYPETSI
jgi:hypothetical protein